MKKLIFSAGKMIIPVLSMILLMATPSCVPDGGPAGGPNKGEENETPVQKDPEGTITISLYSDVNPDHADNIDGIYFSTEGYLTSKNGWRFSYTGHTNCLANVDFIPRNTWIEQINVSYEDGFVAYNDGRGFFRFFVYGIATDEYGKVVGLLLKYDKAFYGKDEAPTLSKTSVQFSAKGGEESIAVTSKTYTVFQAIAHAKWCTVRQTASVYPYITDGIEIVAEANTTDEARETDVVLSTHGGKNTIVKVRQAGVPQE